MANRRIDDHAFWAGKPEKGCVFPKEAKLKEIPPSDGQGGIMNYPDTAEDIHRDQEHGDAKIRSKPMKPGYRY